MNTCIRLCCLLVVFAFGSSSTSIAATLNDIINDLQPIDGYVVDVVNGQILINLGSDAGVHKDDIFTVFRAGKKITDPVTGKVLGQLETRAGLITATRVEKIFSYAKLIGTTNMVKRGDHLVRFKEITAAGIDTTGHSGHFLLRLRQGLPALNWQDKQSSRTELVFIREGDFLTVKNLRGKVIHEYSLNQPASRPAAPLPATTNPYAPVYGTAAATGGAVMAAGRANGKVRYDLQNYGYNQGGSLPFTAIMGDFLSLDGTMNLAVIQEHSLAVYLVDEKGLQNIAKVKIPLTKLLSVCWWQPVDGVPYIAVTGYDEDEDVISSLIFRFNKTAIAPVKKQFPYILGSSDVDGDGRPETLLAQNYDQDTFFGRGIRQVKLTGTTITTGKYSRALAVSFRVAGGAIFKPTETDGLVSAYLMANKLHIARGAREIYLSGKEMGGSLSAIRYVQNPGDTNPLFFNAKIEVRPLAVDIDNDGTREILVPSADLSPFTSIGGASDIKKTWVSVLKKTETGSYMKGKIGGNYDQYIQGLGTANGSLYLLMVNSGGIFSEGKGSSQLLILPMGQ